MSKLKRKLDQMIRLTSSFKAYCLKQYQTYPVIGGVLFCIVICYLLWVVIVAFLGYLIYNFWKQWTAKDYRLLFHCTVLALEEDEFHSKRNKDVLQMPCFHLTADALLEEFSRPQKQTGKHKMLFLEENGKNDDKELKEYLNKRDIQMVQQSWSLIQDDVEHVGLIMFQRLFTKQRQLKKLFSQLMTKENSGEFIFDESKLRSHGKMVMDTLGAAVECLDDSSQLTILLVEIGERHAHYGVRPDMIPLLRPAIVTALEEKLGQYFSLEVGQAWEHVFNYIGSKMMKGIARWCDTNSAR